MLVQYEFLNLLWHIFTQSTPLCISSPHYFIILKNHIQSFHHCSSLHPCDCLRALTTISLKFFITSNSLNERIRPSNDPQWQWLVQKCRTILQNLHWIEFLDSSLLSAAAAASSFWWSFSSSLSYTYILLITLNNVLNLIIPLITISIVQHFAVKNNYNVHNYE